MTELQAAPAPEITPPPIDGDKVPVRVNAFEFLRHANSALLPMFPYDEPGSIMPCGGIFRSGGGKDFSAFQHLNTVDEIVICFGSNGTQLRPGQVAAGPRKHHVSVPFSDPDNEEHFVMMTITQRQAEKGETQHEEHTFFCEKCQEPLVHEGMNAYTGDVDVPPERKGYSQPSMTIRQTLAVARQLDASEEARTCKACGHVNKPFPYELWGWNRYDDQAYCSERALDAFLQLGNS